MLIILKFSFTMELIINKISLILQFARDTQHTFATFDSSLKLSLINSCLGFISSIFELILKKLTHESVPIWEGVLWIYSMFLPILQVPLVFAVIIIINWSMNKLSIFKLAFEHSNIFICKLSFSLWLIKFNVPFIKYTIFISECPILR